MALTVTTDLTVITAAESLTGWTQDGGTDASDTDYFAQGAGCISLTYNSGSERGSSFDIGAGNVLNFTTTHAGKLIYIWMRCAVPALIGTRASGGMKIRIGSGATAPTTSGGVWSAWYVDGSDTIQGTDGWKCYVIDPTLLPSQTFGGGVDLTAVRWFGGTMTTTASVKGNPFGIDQISYGLGELRCRGSNTTPGAGFKEMSNFDFGTINNRYGIVVEKQGIFFVQGKLVLGDSISTNTTDFTSEDEVIVWERKTYYDGTREAACVKDLNPNTGMSYAGLDIRGNGTGNTNVTFGVKVGTGDTASGRSGPLFTGHRGNVAFDFDDGNVENVLIYGTTFKQIRGGIDMSGNASTDEFIGNIISGCGSFLAGPTKVRSCNFISNIGAAPKIFEDFFYDGRLNKIDIVTGGSFWLLTAGNSYIQLGDPGASDSREVLQVNAIDSAGLTVTVAAAGGTYTRSAGSYITDGFRVGQTVTWSGFTNAGNNATKVIFALTATVMTTSITGLVNETGNGDERVIDSSGVESDDHYSEAVIRWPSAGANQGSLGVTIRGALDPTENYDYLKCDIRNSQISLVRCDAGVDTVIDGPDSFTFAEDTDYLIHLIGRGTLIEGFVNGGNKVLATGQTNYQTNRRIGIRGDAEADQTGDAPRLYKLAGGPASNKFGAISLLSANDDVGYSNFINNLRALGLQTTGTYASVNNNFSGNLVDIRDDSSGATTINITGTGGSPLLTKTEEVDDAITTISASVTLTVTVKKPDGIVLENARVAIFTDNSGEVELMNELTNASGIATETYAYSGEQSIFVRIRAASGVTAYQDVEANGTITASGFTLEVTLAVDANII